MFFSVVWINTRPETAHAPKKTPGVCSSRGPSRQSQGLSFSAGREDFIFFHCHFTTPPVSRDNTFRLFT